MAVDLLLGASELLPELLSSETLTPEGQSLLQQQTKKTYRGSRE
jgi:hypothetical protein